MSELINNREYRQKVLKELIMELHEGKSVEEVRERFEKLIEGVSASEISQMEQSLIMEGMPVEEVQRLCDVHAAVFKGSIEDIHKPQGPQETPGHPVHTFITENRSIERLIEYFIKPAVSAYEANASAETRQALLNEMKKLLEIDKHYARKENLLFPYLEKAGITGPPKVMWGVDDEIRADIKNAVRLLSEDSGEKDQILEAIGQALNKVKEMIFKEENILFPMSLETLSEDEWLKIADQSPEIGYFMMKQAAKWKPERSEVVKENNAAPSGSIVFSSGALTSAEMEAMLNTIPVDITFIDKNDVVKYFNIGKDRIFPRPTTVIGRTVQNCHPPKSVHVVEKMLADFKAGVKDYEDFWIKKGPDFVYIRYFAVRGRNNEYLGTLEFTQNIKPIKELEGEKRLLSD